MTQNEFKVFTREDIRLLCTTTTTTTTKTSTTNDQTGKEDERLNVEPFDFQDQILDGYVYTQIPGSSFLRYQKESHFFQKYAIDTDRLCGSGKIGRVFRRGPEECVKVIPLDASEELLILYLAKRYQNEGFVQYRWFYVCQMQQIPSKFITYFLPDFCNASQRYLFIGLPYYSTFLTDLSPTLKETASYLLELMCTLSKAKTQFGGFQHYDIKEDNIAMEPCMLPRVYTVQTKTFVAQTKFRPVLIDFHASETPSTRFPLSEREVMFYWCYSDVERLALLIRLYIFRNIYPDSKMTHPDSYFMTNHSLDVAILYDSEKTCMASLFYHLRELAKNVKENQKDHQLFEKIIIQFDSLVFSWFACKST